MSNLDRETRDHYAVVIQAKDMAGSVGGLSGSTTVNITLTDVNDNPPKFPQSEWRCSFAVRCPCQTVAGGGLVRQRCRITLSDFIIVHNLIPRESLPPLNLSSSDTLKYVLQAHW